jgi:protease-4
MTKSPLARIFALRIVRVAILCVILVALAWVFLYLDHTALGVSFLLVALAIGFAFFLAVIRPARIPRDAVLLLRLSGQLPEEPQRSLIDQIRGRSVPALTHLRYALDEIRRDGAIRALVVEVAGIDNGLATAEELHDLLRRVRESGKRVIAVLDGDSAGIREYLVASAADEIVCNPDTMLTMLGVSAGGVFLKRALEKLHVQVQTLQYKEYKGAAEMFSRDGMSAPLRESLQAVVGDWRQVLTDRIARARNLPVEKVAELVGRGFLSARDAREAELIDREGYLEDVRA